MNIPITIETTNKLPKNDEQLFLQKIYIDKYGVDLIINGITTSNIMIIHLSLIDAPSDEDILKAIENILFKNGYVYTNSIITDIKAEMNNV